MVWACMEDFSPRDIRDPQPPRLRRILSALVNFYLFEQDQMEKLEALEAQSEELAKGEHAAERRHVELQNDIGKKKWVFRIMARTT
jgi:kinetochore protein Nuf2